jgi:hypothetical protein
MIVSRKHQISKKQSSKAWTNLKMKAIRKFIDDVVPVTLLVGLNLAFWIWLAYSLQHGPGA